MAAIFIKSEKTLVKLLTYMGAIPFVCLALLSKMPLSVSNHDAISRAFGFYGLCIAVFLSGALWGQSLYSEKQGAASLLLLSNVITVLLWLSSFFFLSNAYIVFLAVVFLALLFMDKKMPVHKDWYISLRFRITAIVFLSLVVYLL